jgi:sensor histidine kinase YesM
VTYICNSDGKIYSYRDSEIDLVVDSKLLCIDYWVENINNIIVLTSESIYRIDLQNKIVKKVIDTDYFSGSEFNKIKISNKIIVASSNDGIHFIRYKELLKPKDPPQLNFLKSNSNEILISNGEELSYDNNNVSLDYDLISFNSLGRQTILFKLLRNKEVIAEYKEIETGKIELDNLKPGSYEVLVKGIDTYSNESPIQTFNFKIKKPYWQSIWFYFFIFFMSAFLFYMLSKIVVKRTEQKKEKEFKAKIKLAELELSALQSQLNPHFIFNAMGSIQGLIQGGEIDLADEYLAKFSRLMRHFLSSSKSKSNKLVHELEIIEDYINIEKLRYNNFDFHLEIDDKINVLGLDVPSLFIQPFIENSIAHGLFHKKGRGELKLLLKEEGEGMTVEIIDNGIGRAASKRINANSISNYKSYGMSLIKDRLTTLNSISSVPFRFNIVDLEVGTKVTLWIPYNNNLAA